MEFEQWNVFWTVTHLVVWCFMAIFGCYEPVKTHPNWTIFFATALVYSISPLLESIRPDAMLQQSFELAMNKKLRSNSFSLFLPLQNRWIIKTKFILLDALSMESRERITNWKEQLQFSFRRIDLKSWECNEN